MSLLNPWISNCCTWQVSQENGIMVSLTTFLLQYCMWHLLKKFSMWLFQPPFLYHMWTDGQHTNLQSKFHFDFCMFCVSSIWCLQPPSFGEFPAVLLIACDVWGWCFGSWLTSSYKRSHLNLEENLVYIIQHEMSTWENVYLV